MPVGSTIELYTTLLAWFMYDALWDLITGTGIVMVPFIVVIIQMLKDDATKPLSTKDFVAVVETRIYLMVFIMTLTAAPMVKLYTERMSYTDMSCVAEQGKITQKRDELGFENTGTQQDVASTRFMSVVAGSEPSMPLWWYFWGRLSIAFTNTLKAMLPCNPDFRTLSQGMGSLVIRDQDLQDEVRQFYRDCWAPGVQRYWRDRRNGTYAPPDQVTPLLNAEQDISWIGSRILLDNPHYYGELRAEKPLKRWPYREFSDANMASKEAAGGQGFPYCKEWWDGPEGVSMGDAYEGLRNKVYMHITEQEEYSRIGSWWDYFWDSQVRSTDLTAGDRDKIDHTIRTAISNTDTQLQVSFNRSTDNGGFGGFMDGVNNIVTNLGVGIKSLSNRAEANTYRAAAPIVQSLLLMALIMFLPLMLVMGLYDMGKVMTLSLIYFSLVFWGYLFHLADYIDSFLVGSLMSSQSSGMNVSALDMVAPQLSGLKVMASDATLSLQVLSWITRMLYVLLPGVFFWLMYAVGINMGQLMSDGIKGWAGSSAQGGALGAQLATKTVTKGKI